jgi:hypothetical protein
MSQEQDIWDEIERDMKTAVPDSALNDNNRVLKLAKHLENVFIPTKENRPPELKPIVSINGTPILTHQNLTTIIAAPGSGKSSVCEAICSAAINAHSDNLGIEVSNEITKVLFFDTERVNMDVWNSYDRINKRANTIDSDRAQIIGLRMIPRTEQRRATIEKLISEYRPELIILDGAGDMVTDTNSLEQAIDCRIWFRELTMKYNLSIITTLHPNKGTNNPRGHIGAEILRESHGVLIIETDGDIKTLTNEFTHGKNRNGAKVNTSFTWSDEQRMFVSCEQPINTTKKSDPHTAMSNEDIIKLVAECVENEPTASEFKAVMKLKLQEHHPKAKRGATAINDFYTWLQIHKFIEVKGTKFKKVVIQVKEPDKVEQTKIEEND